MQPISFTEQQPGIDPMEIERKRRLAEMLREQSQAPIQYQQNAPISWTQGLAKMLQAYGANKKEKEVDKESNTYRTQLAESIRGGGTLSEMADRMAQVNPELAMQLRIEEAKQQAKLRGKTPSNIEEWGSFQQMSEPQKEEYLRMKRASPPVNLGDMYGNRNQLTGEITPAPGGQISLKPGEQPGVRYQQEAAKQQAQTGAIVPQAQQTAVAAPIIAGGQAAATAITAPAEAEAKALGEAKVELEDRLATLPRLEEVVSELSELGKKATYTKAGQAKDTIVRELGMDVGEGAIARKEYISKVDNEILPLLRQTFGAQFTEREGTSLKATLGDPNASPTEKDAVLKSFIATKKAQVDGLKNRVGQASDDDDLINKYIK